MKHKRIFTIGETVYDILFKDVQPITGTPGGAMLNTSVSLGRLGIPVEFISEIGMDDIGNMIVRFLRDNGVCTKNIHRFEDGKTAIAAAFLDDDENASYTFYKDYPSKRLSSRFPVVRENDLVLFGSFFAITKEVRKQLIKFLRTAKNAGAIIIYDPNFRKPHLKDLLKVKNYIMGNIAIADIIRGSNEDFQLIFGIETSDEAFAGILTDPKKILIYTSGPGNVQFRTRHSHFSFEIPNINPVSTIGAGDNFNAGILYSLFKLNISKDILYSLKKAEWETIIDTGITFGTIVCESFENYISAEFASKVTEKT